MALGSWLFIAVDVFGQVPLPQTHVPPWDVNKDGIIDMLDLVTVVSNFGKEKPQRGDIDGNGIVDIFDLVNQRVASGVYFYNIRAAKFTATRKMIILK